MKSKKILGFASLASVAMVAAFAIGEEPQKAVLNVRQNGLDSIDGGALDAFDEPTTAWDDEGASLDVAEDVVLDDAALPLSDAETFDPEDDPILGDLGDLATAETEPAVPAEPEPVAAEPVVAESDPIPEDDDLLVDAIAPAPEPAVPAPAPAVSEASLIDDILSGASVPEEDVPAVAVSTIPGDGVIEDEPPETLVPAVTSVSPLDMDPLDEPVEEVALVEPVEEVAPVEPVVAGGDAGWETEPVPAAATLLGPAAPAVPAPAAPAAAKADDPVARAVSEINKLEELRRKLLIGHGRDCLRQADEAMAFGNWDRAIELYKSSLDYLIDMESTHAERNAANAGLGEAYYRKGLAQMELKNYTGETGAETMFRTARSYSQYSEDPNFGHRLDAEIEQARQFQLEPPPPPPPPHVARWDDPKYVKAQEDIRRRLTAAREYYASGEYTDCRREIELILHDYPWSEDALFLLRKLARRETRFIDEERRTTRDRMIRDVGKTWTPNNYAIDFLSGGIAVTDDGQEKPPIQSNLTSEMRIREKMERIMIPEIDFRQANINDVITFLSEASRENDQDDVPAELRGVNFVLDLGETSSGDVAAPADSADPWGEPTATATASSGVPLLTIKSYHLSLAETLNMVVDMAKLKYRVQGNIVMIMPKNKAEGDLIHRMYNVLPSIGERVASISSGAAGSGEQGDPFGLPSGEVKATSDWKEFFGKLGVAWPDESSVSYMPQIGKLIVKNTPDNLATLERVLGALNVTPYQVEIEVRFVEVGQTDINSLGLEWILGDDWEIAHNRDDEGLPAQAQRRIVMEKGNITGGFNYLTGNARETVNSGSPIADNIARFSSVLTNPQLSVVLHALANRTNADLLSAPKVVAMNGNKATIKSVVEYIYPTEYDVEMLESSNSNNDSTTYTGAVVEPQSFQTKEVGVILEVTPRVSPDGSRIGLDLTPSVVSVPTWKNYGSTYPVFNEDGSEDYVQLNMEQPFFPVRSLATTVEIYNGSTVVMGGMITEERYSEEDKIPILGDIPILGRLFRYQYDQSEKKNLLIFVSARLVDPAGRTIDGAGTVPGLEGLL